MSIGLCRTIIQRNSSSTSQLSASNQSIKTDIEWITICISLIIFALAFLGNTAALIVMFGKQGPIRLTNSRYLANLACADLLRACFMPFTIIARMKRNFMFGKMICKILPVVQGLSVAVGVFTLVCISIERYLAICHPLRILKLQSVRYAKLVNGFILISIWISGLVIALPNIYIHNLCLLPKTDRYKCEKIAPDTFNEKIYMIFLDAFYFVIPIVVMMILYISIICKMYRNSTAKKMRAIQNSLPYKTQSFSSSISFNSLNNCFVLRSKTSQTKQDLTYEKSLLQSSRQDSTRSRSGVSDEDFRPTTLPSDCYLEKHQYERIRTVTHPVPSHLLPINSLPRRNIQRLSSENSSKKSCSSTISRIDRQRRKALKLLITLIVEFFVCWTPLFIFHTIGTFHKNFYRVTSNIWLDFILLFSFASASCNPLTYYFMSKRYRLVLYAYFSCCFLKRKQQIMLKQRNRQAKQLIKVLRSSQQQNSSERNVIEQTRVNLHRDSRLRSKTVH
ncbi:hypothetical protein I4U23_015030 [Adineta vaga]|nr:hypothetical protein I4U23_015030 [Adineta vaga]